MRPTANGSTCKALMAALAVGVLALAGCGSSSSTSSSASPSSAAASTSTGSPTTSSTASTGANGGAQVLHLAANTEGQLKYDTTSLTAKSGKVSIAFTNASPLAHNVTVASSSGAVVGATATFQGGSRTFSLDLAPGTYKFYCTVPGHRAAGMEGTLTVR